MGTNSVSVPQHVLANTHAQLLDLWKGVEHIFPVEIPSTKNVGDLINAIRNKKSVDFHDIDNADLILYQVPPSYVKEHTEDGLNQWMLSDNARLNPLLELSQLFPHSDETGRLIIVSPSGPHPRTSETVVVVPDMTLNCWVRNDTTSNVFSIKISSTETVAALKEVIKNEDPEGFRDVDASDLFLYKASLPLGSEPLRNVLGTLTMSSLGKCLDDLQNLSAVFVPLPLDGHLHLIIDSSVFSSRSFQCWIRGADPVNSFGVRISMKASVDSLKNAIKAAYGRDLDHLSPDRLQLYKIPVDEEAKHRESLIAPASGQLLQENELDIVFGDVPFFQNPRVVVEPLNEEYNSGDIRHQRMKYIQAWDESPARNTTSAISSPLDYIREWNNSPRKSPSEQGKPSNFAALQSTDLRIEWGRPGGGPTSIPVTLLHPVFGQFVDDCDTHEPSWEDNAKIFSLMFETSGTGSQQQEEIIDILYSCSIGTTPSSLSNYDPDGDAHKNTRRYMIVMKPEVSTQGAEPSCQGILYYIEESKDEVEKALMNDVQFNFPCLVIILFGPYISFSGAVWTNRPNYQILTTALSLWCDPTDTTMRKSGARQIGAFTKACQSLKGLYERFDQSPADFKHLQPEFPYPRCYTSLDGKNQVSFRYIHTLEASKPLFLVEMDSGEQLCVKFVRTYGRTVHEQCASWGIAPSLRGFDAIPGGWHLVAMDFLEEEHECFYDVKYRLSYKQKKKLRDELRRKLTDLHQMDLVHGDLRDVNLMVKKDRSGWKLIDFDWSGKIGEVRYPMNVTCGLGLRRPENAIDGKLIIADHDMEMLDYLFYC